MYKYGDTNISENYIREKNLNILKILLIDRTTSTDNKVRNIIWGNNNYIKYGRKLYSEKSQILPELITGINGNIIMPRALKDRYIKKKRTRSKAEVFTPSWIVKSQNDQIDRLYNDEDINSYVSRTFLEITCGEAPYVASRYDMDTGEKISLNNRVGFLDRKLKIINYKINDYEVWVDLVEKSYKSCFGYEWNGDSLLIARENILYTFIDFFYEKWKHFPDNELLKYIAEVISYNFFQMDGINNIVPFSDNKEIHGNEQLTLDVFENEKVGAEIKINKNHGKKVKIMNWEKNRMENFDLK
ncbi:type II restriction endonuclease [Apilactobacillus kunkeei EFB6]|uniref:Type II restriction endonuclease n=2 Tax=Apilactobacillus kunkeei TaxID=148814 RepID=A0A837B058_9LACO|nr:type II restriction endonuclease [Apilactobacillus kunkeei EFB6]CAI2555547.1 hypothetical protein AKUH3B203M_01110 [Apilactobacillus kunkeei]CAI2801027.1 hypothetical protein AKUH3B203M04_05930 [Apilactobacillus kunkeei]